MLMLCLSNFEVFAVIFTLRTFNYIILHIINFMLCLFVFIVQVIILSGMFNFMVPLVNCMTYSGWPRTWKPGNQGI